MQRRSFIKGFVGAIAAAAVSARLVSRAPEVAVEDPETIVRGFVSFRDCEGEEIARLGPDTPLTQEFLDSIYARLVKEPMTLVTTKKKMAEMELLERGA